MTLQESIRKVLKEETQGIDSFLIKVMETYPNTGRFIDNIETFIKNSNCKKIEVAKFKYPALGLAVHNGVLFNEVIFKQELPDFLFIIFHEIAHQYHYKKYGDAIGMDLVSNPDQLNDVGTAAKAAVAFIVNGLKRAGIDPNSFTDRKKAILECVKVNAGGSSAPSDAVAKAEEVDKNFELA